MTQSPVSRKLLEKGKAAREKMAAFHWFEFMGTHEPFLVMSSGKFSFRVK